MPRTPALRSSTIVIAAMVAAATTAVTAVATPTTTLGARSEVGADERNEHCRPSLRTTTGKEGAIGERR